MDNSFVCPTCGKHRPVTQRVQASRLRAALRDRLAAEHPGWDGKLTCRADVHKYRVRMLREAMEAQGGVAPGLDPDVLARMEQNQFTTEAPEKAPVTLGERVADQVASFGGSWNFLGIFAAILAVWMLINVAFLRPPFDPYPFILLNLVLSCVAAMQAPVIMMSQNRQAKKDRERAEQDYRINLRAELEVHLLHDKMDHLLLEEWQRLLEIQALQSEMLEELLREDRRTRNARSPS